MDENEKFTRILLGSLLAITYGIDVEKFNNEQVLAMIALIVDLIAKKLKMELTSSQTARLKEETAMFVLEEISKELKSIPYIQ